MRTNIDIDDKLLQEAMKYTKITIKKDLINHALSELIKLNKRQNLKSLQGKVPWDGNLADTRTYDKWENS